MKTNELRVGNLIEAMYYNEDNEEVFEVVSILAIDGTGGDLMEHTYWFEGGTQEQYFDFNEIPLTKEWLLKFRFISDSIFGTYVKYSLNCIEIWHDKNKNTFLLGNIKNKKVYLPYVHKLQNIYFELMGTELELNK